MTGDRHGREVIARISRRWAWLPDVAAAVADGCYPRHSQRMAQRGACRKAPAAKQNQALEPSTRPETTASTSAFNLPERLLTKAEPAMVAGDELHLAAVAESLARQVADLSDGDRNVTADGGGSSGSGD